MTLPCFENLVASWYSKANGQVLNMSEAALKALHAALSAPDSSSYLFLFLNSLGPLSKLFLLPGIISSFIVNSFMSLNLRLNTA